MKSKYFIGELEFKTKKECENYTRTIINTLGCCQIKKENVQYEFFNDLIQNHPECDSKIGVGIDYFYIKPNPFVKKYFQTMIKRVDGSEIDFSWVYCCKFKERTLSDHLIRSMRMAIKNDILEYKQKQTKLICNFCQTENELYEDFHVDHHNPSFKTIKNNFLQETTKSIPSSFDDCKIFKISIFKDEDKDFKNDWVDYHKKNCNFQILCRDCNLRKPKS